MAFCGPCAREQEAYFAIGELTQEKQGLRSEALAEALGGCGESARVVKEAIAAELHHGLSGAARPSLLRSGTANITYSEGRVQEFGTSICFRIQRFWPRRAKKPSRVF